MDRLKKWLMMGLAISIISVILILIFTVDSETVNSLRRIQPIYLLIAIGVHVLSWFVWGLRMKLLTESLGGKISLWRSTEIVISNLLAAAVTPSHAGGEPVRIHLLSRNGITIGDATAVVFGERLLDALLLGLAVPIALFVFKDLMRHNLPLSITFALAGLLFCAVFSLTVYAMYRPNDVKSWISRIRVIIPKFTGKSVDHILERINDEIDHFHDSLWTFTGEGRGALYLAMVCTIAFWLLEFVIPSLILLGLGANPIWMFSIMAQFVLMVIIMLPITPGSSGLVELGIISLYTTFVRSSIIGIFVVAWRAMTYYLNVVVGGVISLKILRDTRLIESSLES